MGNRLIHAITLHTQNLPAHHISLDLHLLRLGYVPCSAPVSAWTCLSTCIPLCCNYLVVPDSHSSMYFSSVQCWALSKSSLNERGRGKGGRERTKKATRSSKQFSVATSSSLLPGVRKSPLAGNLGARASPGNRPGNPRAVEAVMRLWVRSSMGASRLWLCAVTASTTTLSFAVVGALALALTM